MTKTIVVGYDGGGPATRALDRAIEEARGSSARLVVVAVAEMPLNPEGPRSFGTLDDSPAATLPLVAPPELESILTTARGEIEPTGLAADYVWAAGEPAEAIVATARDLGAELIVVGSHHHGRVARLFGLDVTAAVRREADCEVIAVE